MFKSEFFKYKGQYLGLRGCKELTLLKIRNTSFFENERCQVFPLPIKVHFLSIYLLCARLTQKYSSWTLHF